MSASDHSSSLRPSHLRPLEYCAIRGEETGGAGSSGHRDPVDAHPCRGTDRAPTAAGIRSGYTGREPSCLSAALRASKPWLWERLWKTREPRAVVGETIARAIRTYLARPRPETPG